MPGATEARLNPRSHVQDVLLDCNGPQEIQELQVITNPFTLSCM